MRISVSLDQLFVSIISVCLFCSVPICKKICQLCFTIIPGWNCLYESSRLHIDRTDIDSVITSNYIIIHTSLSQHGRHGQGKPTPKYWQFFCTRRVHHPVLSPLWSSWTRPNQSHIRHTDLLLTGFTSCLYCRERRRGTDRTPPVSRGPFYSTLRVCTASHWRDCPVVSLWYRVDTSPY